MDSEQQPRELTRLIERLVGAWDVEMSIRMLDGSILQGKGELKAQEVVDGFGIRTEMELDVEGLGKYVEEDLWGYQRWERKIHIYSITTTAAVHDHVGEWADADTLILHWQGLNEGKPSAEELTLKWLSSTEIHGHEVDSVEGTPETELDYVFRKR